MSKALNGATTEEKNDFWTSRAAAVEVPIDVPQTRGPGDRAFRNLAGFLATAFKKRAVEVSEKRMTEEESEASRKAKSVEVNNFIAAKAFEALLPGYRARREDGVWSTDGSHDVTVT